MRRGSDTQREVVRHAIETGAVEELDRIVAIVRDTGALDGARAAAASEAQRAIEATKRLPANPHTEGLLQLAASLLQRRN
jgi:octaprenyl-diphosphate synthase